MRKAAFERMVGEILDELPEEFARRIENVEFLVEPRPSFQDLKGLGVARDELLIGLYQGTALPLRSPTSYAGTLPDQIVIFQKNVEEEAGRPGRIRDVLRTTILHEIGHYFGLSEKRLRELGVD
ncbi:MAG: metallopeptidase family protein [Pseudomonadota bacterium]